MASQMVVWNLTLPLLLPQLQSYFSRISVHFLQLTDLAAAYRLVVLGFMGVYRISW